MSPDSASRSGRLKSRLARRLRKALLCAIALLFAASIPWYRGDAPVGRLLGLPDWVAVAIVSYVAVAILTALAWLRVSFDEDDVADDADDAEVEP